MYLFTYPTRSLLYYYAAPFVITYFSRRKSGGCFKLLIFLRRSHTRGRFTFPIIYHINNSPVRYIIYTYILYIHIYIYISYIIYIHRYTVYIYKYIYKRERHAMEKGSEVKDYVKNIFSSPLTPSLQHRRFAGLYDVLLFPFPTYTYIPLIIYLPIHNVI